MIKRRWGRAALSDRAIFRRSDCQNRNDLDQTGKILRILHPVSGVAALEAALTLPALCSLIFFTLELVRINITQAAINAICVEMTFDFIATRSWNNFEAI
ncbi:MAG: pilus assembly protein, partial [Holosporaceae bacterium]|nr:pilus assembly protein [Holosporaceae bacterium]